jgi:phosphomannomutase / phosphoglucomutase
MDIKKEIFRAYDIRGIYPSELNEHSANLIAKALGTKLRHKKYKQVVVGYDDRVSSLGLVNSVVDGLISTGIDVINTGITVQPAIHYFTMLEGIDAGINITASHNPGMYNGIKIDYKNAMPLYGEQLAELRDIAETGRFVSGKGKYVEKDLNSKYIEHVASKFKLKKHIKVVIYCGNGATSNIYPQVLEKIGANVIPLRCYLDSEFPAGLPNPESGNFSEELKAQVLESRAAVGVGFDGDGDRMGAVDEKGNFYRADEIFMLYIQDVLSKKLGATIGYDVKCSQIVADYITQLGGKPKMLRTGRSYILDELYNDRVLIACELSGHTYFKDHYHGFDDGIYATCRLLKIIDDSDAKLSFLMKQFPKTVSTPEIKVDCPDERKFLVVDAIVKDIDKLHSSEHKFLDINKTDGVRVKVTPTGWFLIRASNTSPYLSIRAEGKDAKELQSILDLIARLLKRYSLPHS